MEKSMLITAHRALAALLLVTIALSLILEIALFRDTYGRRHRLRHFSDRLSSLCDPLGVIMVVIGFFAYDLTLWFVFPSASSSAITGAV